MKNTNKGITLIALVITIIIMLILVAVTISMAVNGGLFEYAQRAGTKTNEATEAEQLLASGRVEIDGTVYNSIDKYVNAGNKGGFEEIFKTATKHPQQTESNDIGIAEDGSAVNLDLWLYTLIGNSNEYVLSGGEYGSQTTPGYKNENITADGKIQGEVPMYIKEAGKSEYYPVTSMDGTFNHCEDLVIAPQIPSTVITMDSTFYTCASLTTAPEIPSGVTNLNLIFGFCPRLTGTLKINTTSEKVTVYNGFLHDAATTEGCALVLEGPDKTLLNNILGTASANSKVTIKQ